MTLKILLFLCLVVSPVALAQQTVEERLTALEARLAELETKIDKGGNTETRTPAEKPTGLVFHEGFEEGIAGWVEEIRFLVPEHITAKNHPYLQVKSWEKFRSTKELKTSSGIINPKEGKRFLTAASEEQGVVILNSAANAPTSVIPDWRAVHYFSTKEPISLGDLKLPVVTAQINLKAPSARDRETRPGGLFIIGYYLEGGDLNSFVTVGTVASETEDWKEVEFDFSGAPKDQKIHFTFAYVCGDSRTMTAPGLQIDDIKIFDDGI